MRLPDKPQVGQRLQRFSQTHFVGENAAKAVGAQKMQPRHALFLIGAQHRFQVAERRAFQLCFTTLLRRALAPRRRRLDFPIGMLPQRRFKETGLCVVDAIAGRVLLRRAIEQHFLQFLHRASVNHRHPAVLQARVVLPGQDQPLDIRRRKGFAAGGREHDA